MITKAFTKVTKLSKHFSKWSHIPEPPKDPILSLNADFKASTAENKVNLTIGAYRDEQGNPWLLPSVKKAMIEVNKNLTQMEYLPPVGDPEFIHLATKVGYGENSKAWQEGRIAGCQTLSGTGAVFIALNFLRDWWQGNNTQVYTPTPTWPVHNSSPLRLNMEVIQIPYYDPATRGLDFEKYSQALLAAPDKSIILLHAVSHNPTGVDPSPEQWVQLRDIFAQKGHMAFFDMAYQGFASGSLEKDGASIALWEEAGLPFVLGQSFAKSMGLYGMRTGSFQVITEDAANVEAITAQLGNICRQTWQSPPLYSAAIAKTLIGNPEYFKLWQEDMITMSQRIASMRQRLREELTKAGNIY